MGGVKSFKKAVRKAHKQSGATNFNKRLYEYQKDVADPGGYAVDEISDAVIPDMPDIDIPEAPIYAQTPQYMDSVRRKRAGSSSTTGRRSTILTGQGGSTTGSTGKTLLGG